MNVSRPTAIHGSRQIATATSSDGSGTGRPHSLRAAASQSGVPTSSTSAKSRSSESSAPGTRLDVGDPDGYAVGPAAAARRARGSPPCWPRRGRARAPRWRSRSGFFVPRTRCTARSAGCVHQSGRADEPLRARRRQRLGDRRHQRHDPARRRRQRHGIPQVVGERHGGTRPSWHSGSTVAGRCGVRRCGGTGRRPRRRPRSPAGASTPAPRA